MTMDTKVELIERARAGDGDAFRQLTDRHRRELHVHCYRLLGSVHDADDALQDTLVAAWQGIGGFEGRASIRTWLYRVATNRCLNVRRSTRRRRDRVWAVPDVEPIEPTRHGEVSWLEPYPDRLLDELVDLPPGPEAGHEATEAISLAFVTALQVLPPRQRAVLILRDVLGFHADECAAMLQSTVESATSALKRARATMQRRAAESCHQDPPPTPGSPAEQALAARLTRAYETGDIDGLVAMLTDDVWVTMPPVPLEYQGRLLAQQFHRVVTFRQGRTYTLVPTRANGQLAFGAYLDDPDGGPRHASGVLVFTLSGDKVCNLTRFDNGVLDLFELPRTLPV